MIIKGSSRSSAGNLVAHLLRADTNETVRQLGTRGVVANDLAGALDEMAAVAAGSRTRRFLYHASINVERGANLADETWLKFADRLGAKLGLDDRQRAIVLHRKADRDHLHVVWNRVDVETLKSAHMGWNYRKHEQVARDLEREHGLRVVQGVHHEREGQRPDRRPSPAEMQQAERTKIGIPQAEAIVRPIWERADSGRAFVGELAAEGWQLAKGDRNDFTLVDPAGGTHPGAKRLGKRIAALRDKFRDLDLEALPNVKAAQALAAEARQRMAAEREAEAAQMAAAEIARQDAERVAAIEAERQDAERIAAAIREAADATRERTLSAWEEAERAVAELEAQRADNEQRQAEAEQAAPAELETDEQDRPASVDREQERDEQPAAAHGDGEESEEDKQRRRAYRTDPSLLARHKEQFEELERNDLARRQAAAQEAKTWAGPEKRAAQAMLDRHERERGELGEQQRAAEAAERPSAIGRLWQSVQRVVMPGRAAAQDRARDDAAARRQAQREALEERQDREQADRQAANAAKRRDMAHRLDAAWGIERQYLIEQQRSEIAAVDREGVPLREIQKMRGRERGGRGGREDGMER